MRKGGEEEVRRGRKRRSREGGGREGEEKGERAKEKGKEDRDGEKGEGECYCCQDPDIEYVCKWRRISLYEMRGKEGQSPYTSVLTTAAGVASF